MAKKIKKMDCARFLSIVNGKINKDFTSIRFVKKQEINYITGNKNVTYGYFELKDKIIVECERGFSQYKGYELVDCEKVWNDNENKRMRNIFTGDFC